MACPPDVYYDHTVEACVYNSTTCRQCYDGLPTTPGKHELKSIHNPVIQHFVKYYFCT